MDSAETAINELGKLYFTVGLPRSGKSTFCRHWVREQVGRPRVVLSGDSFRKAIHGHSYIPLAEGVVFASLDIAARALLDTGHDVIIDETCTTEATLRRYLSIDDEATPVFVKTPASTCIERASQSGKDYLVGAIKRMNAQLTVICACWDKIYARSQEYVRQRKIDDNVTCKGII